VFERWWRDSPKGGEAMLKDAGRQLQVAAGRPIEWDVAESDAVKAIEALFEDNAIEGITCATFPHHHELLSRRVLGSAT